MLRPEDGNGAGKGCNGSGGAQGLSSGGGASSRRKKEGRTASKSMNGGGEVEVAVSDEAVDAGVEDDGSR